QKRGIRSESNNNTASVNAAAAAMSQPIPLPLSHGLAATRAPRSARGPERISAAAPACGPDVVVAIRLAAKRSGHQRLPSRSRGQSDTSPVLVGAVRGSRGASVLMRSGSPVLAGQTPASLGAYGAAPHEHGPASPAAINIATGVPGRAGSSVGQVQPMLFGRG